MNRRLLAAFLRQRFAKELSAIGSDLTFEKLTALSDDDVLDLARIDWGGRDFPPQRFEALVKSARSLENLRAEVEKAKGSL